jgi:heptosyltransferase-2
VKFLIIQTAFIGDVILATSIIEKLNIFFTDSKIDFLLRKGNEELLKDHPYISKILIWEKKRNKQKNLINILKLVREEKYDYVINLQRFFSTGFITSFSKGKKTIGFDRNPFSFLFTKKIKHIIGNNIHETERNQDLIVDSTDNIAVKPKLYPSEDDFKSVEKYKSQPYICIAPISNWFTKQFPEEKWIDLINKIEWKIYLIGGKEDFEKCENIIKSCHQKNILNLCGKLNILQSAALIRNAKMNYVNDSAPMHIASAMNAPTTAIFCSTIPDFGFGPTASNARIIETKEKLSCRPCGLHGLKRCPEKHFKCSYNIDIENLTL